MVAPQGKRIKAVVAVLAGIVTVKVWLLQVLSDPKFNTATEALL
jgi:hypothetical protein